MAQRSTDESDEEWKPTEGEEESDGSEGEEGEVVVQLLEYARIKIKMSRGGEDDPEKDRSFVVCAEKQRVRRNSKQRKEHEAKMALARERGKE
eukprot:4859230-Pleurochrysis_carterae.AAC.1